MRIYNNSVLSMEKVSKCGELSLLRDIKIH